MIRESVSARKAPVRPLPRTVRAGNASRSGVCRRTPDASSHRASSEPARPPRGTAGRAAPHGGRRAPPRQPRAGEPADGRRTGASAGGPGTRGRRARDRRRATARERGEERPRGTAARATRRRRAASPRGRQEDGRTSARQQPAHRRKARTAHRRRRDEGPRPGPEGDAPRPERTRATGPTARGPDRETAERAAQRERKGDKRGEGGGSSAVWLSHTARALGWATCLWWVLIPRPPR